METLRQAVFLLAAQWVVAAALAGSWVQFRVRRRGARKRRATWNRAARRLLRGAPLAVAALLAVSWSAIVLERPLTRFALLPWVFGTSPLCAGVAWLTRAGQLEARGRLAARRRLARLGGGWLLAGAGLGLALLWTLPGRADAPWLLPATAALLGGCGAAGALGGPSGKPRPAGGIAAVLWVVAQVVLAHGTLLD